MKVAEVFKIICPNEYQDVSIKVEDIPQNVNGKSLLTFSVLNDNERKEYEKCENKGAFIGNSESINIPNIEVDKFYSIMTKDDLSGNFDLVMKKLKRYCNILPIEYIYTIHGLLHELGHYRQFLARERKVYTYMGWCEKDYKKNGEKYNKVTKEIQDRIYIKNIRPLTATKREKIKLEQISREYRQIPKEKDADDFAYKNMKKAIEKLENHLKNIKTRS